MRCRSGIEKFFTLPASYNDLLEETWRNEKRPLYLAVADHHAELVRSALESVALQDERLSIDDVKSGKAFSVLREKRQSEQAEWWSQQLEQAHPDDVVRGAKEVKESATLGRVGDVLVRRRLWETSEEGTTRIRRLDDEFHDAILASLATGAKLYCIPDFPSAETSELIGMKRVGRSGKPREDQEARISAGHAS